jgi:hypothetical protein
MASTGRHAVRLNTQALHVCTRVQVITTFLDQMAVLVGQLDRVVIKRSDVSEKRNVSIFRVTGLVQEDAAVMRPQLIASRQSYILAL